MSTGTITAAQLLTAQDLADRWQVPVSHIYRLARGEQVPVVKLGKYKRFRVGDVEAFERSGGTEADEAVAA